MHAPDAPPPNPNRTDACEAHPKLAIGGWRGDGNGGWNGKRARDREPAGIDSRQPRPPFPACFQVTHRKIFLFSAVFRLRSPMFPAYVSATNTHPPRILDEDSPPQPQAAISDDARRHTCRQKAGPRIDGGFRDGAVPDADGDVRETNGNRHPKATVRECGRCPRSSLTGSRWKPPASQERRRRRGGMCASGGITHASPPSTLPCLLSGDAPDFTKNTG